MERVHSVALEAADLNGLAIVAMHDAGAFAEDIDGADAGATGTEEIRVENCERGAAQVAGGDFFDEARNVDVGGTGGGAGRIEAEEAAVGFDRCLLIRKRR